MCLTYLEYKKLYFLQSEFKNKSEKLEINLEFLEFILHIFVCILLEFCLIFSICLCFPFTHFTIPTKWYRTREKLRNFSKRFCLINIDRIIFACREILIEFFVKVLYICKHSTRINFSLMKLNTLISLMTMCKTMKSVLFSLFIKQKLIRSFFNFSIVIKNKWNFIFLT